ncbi:cupin domain-containing protein [Halomarina oriensis]|uniref:Cupin domain-containing protein n=1 Tax=Halomarina oriensis TaxID=671145 RepID=A0A6B0GMI6_9EURY|nr:cupin domain-containing protein [Halomarina oriensis]MWG35964.1 cupin domain-containing protein [Halomarina oriensis]
MAYRTAGIGETRSVIEDDDGELWPLHELLGTERLSLSVVDLAPGGRGTEHDHTGCDCEEVFLAVQGSVDIDCLQASGTVETVTLDEFEAVSLPPEQSRQLVNRSDEHVRVVVASTV